MAHDNVRIGADEPDVVLFPRACKGSKRGTWRLRGGSGSVGSVIGSAKPGDSFGDVAVEPNNPLALAEPFKHPGTVF